MEESLWWRFASSSPARKSSIVGCKVIVGGGDSRTIGGGYKYVVSIE